MLQIFTVFSRITGSMNNVSSNKFKFSLPAYVCYPQKHVPLKFVRVQYNTTQHKILTNCLSRVNFDKQLLEGYFESLFQYLSLYLL